MQQREEVVFFFPRPLYFFACMKHVLDLQPLLQALPPLLLLFACNTSPGKVTRGKPSDSLQFGDCEIQQNTTKTIDLLWAVALSGIAYTKKTWLPLKIRNSLT